MDTMRPTICGAADVSSVCVVEAINTNQSSLAVSSKTTPENTFVVLDHPTSSFAEVGDET